MRRIEQKPRAASLRRWRPLSLFFARLQAPFGEMVLDKAKRAPNAVIRPTRTSAQPRLTWWGGPAPFDYRKLLVLFVFIISRLGQLQQQVS